MHTYQCWVVLQHVGLPYAEVILALMVYNLQKNIFNHFKQVNTSLFQTDLADP